MKQKSQTHYKRSTKSENLLPKIVDQITNGGLYVQRVRCGKSNCKCGRGERHTAYYFFTRVRGRLVKIYVRKKERARFSAISQRASAKRAVARLAAKQSREMYRQTTKILRDNECSIQALSQG